VFDGDRQMSAWLKEEFMIAGIASALVAVVWWLILKFSGRKKPYPYLFQVFAALGAVAVIYGLVATFLLPPEPFH
jgi:hypothetical protein